MKKKLLVIAGIVAGLIVAVLIGLTLFVKNYLQSDKLKALIIPRAEEATGRKVHIGSIDVSIFSGISVEDLRIKEKDGAGDFAAVRRFVLDYDLLPLLSKKLVISSIKVVEPALQVKRDAAGRFNFDDIIEAQKAGKKGEAPKPAAEGGIPFSVVAEKIAISGAKLEFSDAMKEMPRVSALADADLKVSAGTGTEAMKAAGKVALKSLEVTMGSVATRTSGTIDIDPQSVAFALNTVIGSDTLASTGSVKSYLTAPDVRLDLYAKQLDLEKLMALGGGPKAEAKKAETKPQRGPAAGKGDEAGKKMDIKAAGEIKVDTALYKGNTVKNFLMKYKYAGGVMNIDPLSLNFASGDKADLSGVMKGQLGFRYAPDKGEASDQIKRSLAGKAVVDLDKVQVKQSPIAEAVAIFTGLDDLRRPVFDKGHFDIDIKDQKAFLTGLMTSPRLKVTPSGNIGFDQRLDLLTDIEISPDTAAKMRTGKFTSYLEGKDGWTLIPLKITGTSDKPSVGPNPAALRKTLQRGIQTEIEKQLFKDGSKQRQQKPGQKSDKSQDLIKGLFGR